MSQDTERILFEVSSERKQRWKEEIVNNPDNPHNTMSGAIRYAMQNTFFNGESDGGDSHNVNVNLDPLDTKLDTLLDRIDTIDDTLDWLRLQHQDLDEDPMDVADWLIEMIPEQEPSDFEPITRAAGISDDAKRANAMSTPESYAEAYDHPVYVIAEALDHLEQDSRVGYFEDNGQRRYYRIDE